MRPRSVHALALGTLGLTGAPASAQAAGAAPVTLPSTEVHRLESREIGQAYEVWIARPVPGVMPLPPGPRPVLYVLDANLFFGTAVEMTRIMAQLYGELPPMTIVGVAYPTDDPGLQAELRARDFTPTADSGFEAMARRIPGAREPALPEGERLGGADAFLRFMEGEVIPFVEGRVEVAEGGRTIFGSSLGGLFVLHAFFERPGLYDAWIAVSPAIWWGGAAILERASAEAGASSSVHAPTGGAGPAEGAAEVGTAPPAGAPGRLTLAVGGLEEDDRIPMLAQFRMVTNVHRLAERLQGGVDAGPSVHVLEGESHTTVVPVALTRALRGIHRRQER